jgi:hypothetical protein
LRGFSVDADRIARTKKQSGHCPALPLIASIASIFTRCNGTKKAYLAMS